MITLALDVVPRYADTELWISPTAVRDVPAEDVEGAILSAQGVAERIAGRRLLWAQWSWTVKATATAEHLTAPARPVHTKPAHEACRYLQSAAGLLEGSWLCGAVLELAFDAGYLPAARVTTWQAATLVAVDAWVRLNGRLWRATTAGTTGAALPAVGGGSSPVTDGTVTWQPTAAETVPRHLADTVALAATELWRRGERGADVASIEVGDFRETYRAAVGEAEKSALLPLSLERALEMYR